MVLNSSRRKSREDRKKAFAGKESQSLFDSFQKRNKIKTDSTLFAFERVNSPRENCCQMQIQSTTAVTPSNLHAADSLTGIRSEVFNVSW